MKIKIQLQRGIQNFLKSIEMIEGRERSINNKNIIKIKYRIRERMGQALNLL